jgi:uncharacterized UPF0160 family protein
MKKNKKILITHDGSFHTDDIFAAATLSLILEKRGENFEIIRTRDPKIINTGDYIFDVGGIYNKSENRFDHHQKGGAGSRPANAKGKSGIEYASFGLVWKSFGTELTKSEKAINMVDKRLAAPIDAFDNGFDLVKNISDTSPYFIQHFFISMVPTWAEKNITNDQMFLECVQIAKKILTREIIYAKDAVIAEKKISVIYNRTKNKKIIILDENYPYENVLDNFSEPFFVVYPRSNKTSWGVKAVRNDPKSFKNRKNFPMSWAGLRDEELAKITGVKDAVFCHKALFMAVAKTKNGAIKLAELALKNK